MSLSLVGSVGSVRGCAGASGAKGAVVADAAPLRGGGPGPAAAPRGGAVLVLVLEHVGAEGGQRPAAAQLVQQHGGAALDQWARRLLVLQRAREQPGRARRLLLLVDHERPPALRHHLPPLLIPRVAPRLPTSRPPRPPRPHPLTPRLIPHLISIR